MSDYYSTIKKAKSMNTQRENAYRVRNKLQKKIDEVTAHLKEMHCTGDLPCDAKGNFSLYVNIARSKTTVSVSCNKCGTYQTNFYRTNNKQEG